MILNELGRIVEKFWKEIPRHFSYVNLDEFVIMPNHMHGILRIDKSTVSSNAMIKKKPRNKNHKPEWKPGTIGVVINQFKRICTIKSREIFPDFAWQRNYYDRIIRNDDELNRIRKYIIDNPKMCDRDRNNQGLWL